jgi:hypothetical protein
MGVSANSCFLYLPLFLITMFLFLSFNIIILFPARFFLLLSLSFPYYLVSVKHFTFFFQNLFLTFFVYFLLPVYIRF